jgi:hypothetical protein
LASPFDYIAQVLMLTLVAIYAPEGKKGTWFALMASLMNIALSAGGLLTKYLNKIFVVSREVVSDGVVTVAQDYSQLGDLLWVVVVSSFDSSKPSTSICHHRKDAPTKGIAR